jgi:hypothetical protein
MNKIIRKLHKTIPDNVWKILKNNKVMLAGGTFERLSSDGTVNDLDLYFTTPLSVYSTVMQLISEKYFVVGKTTKSLVMKRGEDIPINIIYMSFFKNLDEVFDMFDFECCKAGFNFADNTFSCSPLYWETLHTKTLTYTGSRYPLGALIRLTKYVKRGYVPEYSSLLKLYRDLKNLNTDDPAIIEEHIGGLYGCNVDLKGLNLDQIIEKLDNTVDYEKPANFIDQSKIEDIFEHLFTKKSFQYVGKEFFDGGLRTAVIQYCDDVMVGIETWGTKEAIDIEPVQFPIVLGKWVKKIGDDVYVSFVDKTFPYRVGNIVEAKKSVGLYVAVDHFKNSTAYHDESTRAYCLIEVAGPEDIIHISNNCSIQIKKGKVLSIVDNDDTNLIKAKNDFELAGF